MTHEELLAKIDSVINYEHWGLDQYFYALRAIAELHKPKMVGAGIYCSICLWDDLGYAIREHYPCETIQAIEKELL